MEDSGSSDLGSNPRGTTNSQLNSKRINYTIQLSELVVLLGHIAFMTDCETGYHLNG